MLNIVQDIDNRIAIRRALISVSDKTGLDTFIPALLESCPELVILSTGGTYAAIKALLKPGQEGRLQAVSDYTGQPEMQGGLVKTLDFKIYMGLLSETYNDAHQADMRRLSADPIDLVVVNLYPFKNTVAVPGVTPEQARTNIDIGGPCMVRASAPLLPHEEGLRPHRRLRHRHRLLLRQDRPRGRQRHLPPPLKEGAPVHPSPRPARGEIV